MRRFLWIAFLVLDAMLLVTFVAGYTARWIDPRTLWWPQLLAIGLPFFSILVFVALLIAAIAKRWRVVLVHLPFAALIFVRFVSFGRSVPEAPNGEDRLSIASYNLGRFDGFSQSMQAKKLEEILSQLHPDIIGLQEYMVSYDEEGERIKNLPYIAHTVDSMGFQSVASEVHDVNHTFQPILSRASEVDQLEQRKIVLAEEDYPEMGLIRMRFAWMGKQAILYNLHLRTFGRRKPWLEERMSPLSFRFWIFYLNQYREAYRHRAWQADRIRQEMEQERLPLVVAGDFNSTPHNWEFHHLAEGMQDVFEKAGSMRTTSYHTRFPLARIDHMLVSADWIVYRAEIPTMEYSDHRPVFVQLGWRVKQMSNAE